MLDSLAEGATDITLVFAVNILIVVLVVIIHYEFLFRLTRLMPTLNIRHRFRIVFGVGAALIAQLH
jgi:hypothetical protein